MMSLLPLFEALGRTGVGQFLRHYTLAFALTEALHLIALSLIGGIVTAVGLGAAGILVSRDSAAAFGRSLRPLFVGALLTVILSGLGLVAAGPYKYYSNPVFWVKMWLLLGAILGYAALDRRLARAGALPGVAWRIGSVLLLLLWLSVAVTGRGIGLI
jgi:hypothetical protein